MNGLLQAALAAMKLRVIYDEARAKARRLVIVAVCGMIALFFVVAALLWADTALYFTYEPRLGGAIAALIAAGALLVVAILAALVAVTVSLSSRPKPTPAPVPAPLGGIPMPDIGNLMRDHKGTILVAAALAGILLANRRT